MDRKREMDGGGEHIQFDERPPVFDQTTSNGGRFN